MICDGCVKICQGCPDVKGGLGFAKAVFRCEDCVRIFQGCVQMRKLPLEMSTWVKARSRW
jgi:hypothetical protein